MRVQLITGSLPPDACGVGDYTHCLASALEKSGLHVEVFCQKNWGMTGTLTAYRRILSNKDTIAHIQYPSMGYGMSLGPQVCALAHECVVTLHEYTKAHILRKIALLPFTFRSPQLVATSEFEKEAIVQKIPWIASRLRVIPIGSNIDASSLPAECLRAPSVVYFGLIMPGKGLEDFVRFAQLVRAKELPWELKIIGKVALGREVYAQQILRSTTALDIQWTIDLDAEQVQQRLMQAKLAYLPYPDGASERRGSLKAALASGLPCISTLSKQTSDDLFPAIATAASPEEALKTASFLMESEDEWKRLSQAALNYSQKTTWPKIAELHIQLYSEMVQNRTRR